jgi:DNA sulfur modification protein DndD
MQSELWFIKLELLNWRQYLGQHSIKFSVDPSKHLTVVHAENSVGKTTMLNAIKWCLYNKTPEFTNSYNLVSDRSEKNSCRVRLDFKYGGVTYTALRVYDQKSQTSKLNLATIEKNGSEMPLSNPDAVINSILPSELSNYFLFAGERYSKALGEDSNVSHIDAIRDILGFTMSERVIDDIGFLKGKYTRKLSALLAKNKDTESLSKELARLDKDKESYDILKKTLNKSLEEQRNIYKKYDDKIKQSSHEEAQSLGREQSDKDLRLKNTKGNRIDTLKRRQKLVNDYGYILFGAKLSKENFDHIKTNHSSIPSPYAENVVQKLIKEQECICGREILPNSNELKKLEELRDSATTKIIETRVMNAIAQGEYFRKRSKDFMSDLANIEKQLSKHNTEIGELEKALIQINKDIAALGKVDISDYQKKRSEANREIDNILIAQGKNERDIEDNKTWMTQTTNKINTSKVSSAETQKLQAFIDISNKIEIKMDKTLKVHETKSLKDIKKLVQTNVDQSLRKEKDVVLTSTYKFELKDRLTGLIDSGSDGGNGQTLLSNLSFISALISTSKDRAKKSEKSIFVPGTIAPFVIDAPFAEMDRSYRLNTFKFLPTQSHQLILFLSTGQWQEAYEDIIGKYIGKRYILVNHDMTNNFEENTLTVKNKTYQLNVQSKDSKSSSTTIKEI